MSSNSEAEASDLFEQQYGNISSSPVFASDITVALNHSNTSSDSSAILSTYTDTKHIHPSASRFPPLLILTDDDDDSSKAHHGEVSIPSIGTVSSGSPISSVMWWKTSGKYKTLVDEDEEARTPLTRSRSEDYVGIDVDPDDPTAVLSGPDTTSLARSLDLIESSSFTGKSDSNNRNVDNKVAEDNARLLDRRRRLHYLCNMVIIIAITSIAESSRGIVLSTINSYSAAMGGSSVYLGFLIATFSVGRLTSSVILGYLSDRSVKAVLSGALVVSVIGNLLYGLALPTGSKALLIIARLVTGFGTGTLSVSRAYIAKVTTTEDRTRFMSYAGAAQFFGFSITPGFAALFSNVSVSSGPFVLNNLTIPGYFVAVINVLVLLALIFGLDEHHAQPPPPPTLPSSSSKKKDRVLNNSSNNINNHDSSPSSAVALKAAPATSDVHYTLQTELRIMKFGVALFLFLNFGMRGALGIAETLMPPLQLQLWGADADASFDSSMYFLALGSVGFAMYLLVPVFTRWVNEDNLLAVAIGIAAIGFFIAIDFDNDQTLVIFTGGAFLVWSVASPITQTLVVSSFSKMLGSKPQGSAMGWITSAGSLGRIVFPLITGYAGTPYSFLCAMIICIVCIASIQGFKFWKTIQLPSKSEVENLEG